MRTFCNVFVVLVNAVFQAVNAWGWSILFHWLQSEYSDEVAKVFGVATVVSAITFGISGLVVLIILLVAINPDKPSSSKRTDCSSGY